MFSVGEGKLGHSMNIWGSTRHGEKWVSDSGVSLCTVKDSKPKANGMVRIFLMRLTQETALLRIG